MDDPGPSVAQWKDLLCTTQPAQTLRGARPGAVLATNPSVVAKFIDYAEQILVVQFAVAGLMAIRHTCNLDVSPRAYSLA